jgi:hypothetical protein
VIIIWTTDEMQKGNLADNKSCVSPTTELAFQWIMLMGIIPFELVLSRGRTSVAFHASAQKAHLISAIHMSFSIKDEKTGSTT